MAFLIPVVFLALVYFFVGIVFWPTIREKLSGNEYFGRESYAVDELKDNTVAFTVNGIKIGVYALRIFYIPHDRNAPFNPQDPINFEISVQIKRGKKIIDKKITRLLDSEDRNSFFPLLWVPPDLFWISKKANLEIVITDITFGEEFSKYFKEVHFEMWYYNPLNQ
jgi:hypothetical protein